jgi:hypothetical protein
MVVGAMSSSCKWKIFMSSLDGMYHCFGGWFMIKFIFIYVLLNLYKGPFIMNVMKLLICVQKYQELYLSAHILLTWHIFFYQI